MGSGLTIPSALQGFANLAIQPALKEPRPALKTIEPLKSSQEDLKAAYRAAHPHLTPAQAFASNGETSPPNSDNPLASDYVGKLNTEIKVNGKVIARIYNSGAMVIANEYSFLGDEMGFGNEVKTGPALADDRANRIKAVLQKYGAMMKDDVDTSSLQSTSALKVPVLELLKASTAQTQDKWVAETAKQGPLEPGTLLSRAV